MADYRAKGSGNSVSGSGTVHEHFTDAAKQVPGPPPDNYYDKTVAQAPFTMSKTPNYVYITKTPTLADIGFFFGSSASFATKATAEGTSSFLTGSTYYVNYGKPTIGTRIDIHPLAWSGSISTDRSSVMFIYKGGIDGQGRG